MRSVLLLLIAFSSALSAAQSFDVVVYGGTAGGVIAAVAAAREGLNTALIEPTAHVGGMVSSGLGYTDYGKKEVIGGYAYEFYYRAGRYYGMNRYGNEVSWLHEPHVGEQIFREMLAGSGVKLIEQARLKEKGAVRKSGVRIDEIETETAGSFRASIFIDASYEGDLMAQSGVSWTWGRESSAQYGESLAGVRGKTPFHQFLVDIPAKDSSGELLPGISPRLLPAPGTADKAVQSYNFRMCFSEGPDRVGFVKPEGYVAARYALLARLLNARAKTEGKVPALGTLMKIDRLPNGTTDINNNGAFSTDFIGGSWNYPNASYAERDEIWRAHKLYTQGLFYFLSHDPAVPASLRAEMNSWGLCPNEFTDSDHWPRQLYIREDRRMVGDFVMTQKDLQTDLTKADPIGMGSYNSDSHNVERIAGPDGFARNEGDMQVAVKPYQIPYRILLPKRAEASNLLVPVAFSASHVAYSSVRMEPQYMILGQAAGVAAKLAMEEQKAVQDLDTARLTERLRSQGAIVDYVPSPQTAALSAARGRQR
ncbi:MAG: FAD-dependent oxidoreductase [Acidobacteriota bacterium]|nr:FAD-dependent oxidoreductase [Acidobacteriota bacterium]